MVKQQPTQGPTPVVSLSPVFKIVLFLALLITIISLVVAMVLCFIKSPNDMQKMLFESCATTWKIGSDAIVGLIGGKVA
jgi:hypothetical protein